MDFNKSDCIAKVLEKIVGIYECSSMDRRSN
jgi:hypothetical protein